MEFRQLEMFAAVAQELSFTRAAFRPARAAASDLVTIEISGHVLRHTD